MNRRNRAAAIREQLRKAEAAGELDHHCHECAQATLYVGVVDAIERARRNGRREVVPALIAAVRLLEMPAASPSVH